MREIKFRFWNAREKKIYPQPLDGWDNFPSFLRMGDVFMQFTGLLDKNGKEIYEDDVVQDYDSRKGIVVWIETGMWGVKSSKKAKTWQDMNYVNGESLWEKIGNIYENPELMK